MSKNTLILGTRKGLIVLKRNGRDWRVDVDTFPGIPISYAAVDPRNDVLWVCADHGHWGGKLYRSADGGKNLTEVPAPKYPEDAVAYDVWDEGAEKPATVRKLGVMLIFDIMAALYKPQATPMSQIGLPTVPMPLNTPTSDSEGTGWILGTDL